jgi:hypothetical protein
MYAKHLIDFYLNLRAQPQRAQLESVFLSVVAMTKTEIVCVMCTQKPTHYKQKGLASFES